MPEQKNNPTNFEPLLFAKNGRRSLEQSAKAVSWAFRAYTEPSTHIVFNLQLENMVNILNSQFAEMGVRSTYEKEPNFSRPQHIETNRVK
jgi:hypothetical protein